MVASTIEVEEKPRLDKKKLTGDLLYGAVKGLGGLALKAFTNLTIEGEENIPLRGKAILTTISQNAIRDMLIVSQTTGRKVHFMLNPKLMKHQVAGPILKQLGMFRSTLNKDDTEPIDKVFEILNQTGDLVAMTPEAKHEKEIQIKSLAGIIKFAIAADAPIIPLAVFKEKTRLFNMIPIEGLKVKIGTPLRVEKKLNREKFRDQRYKLAEDIHKMIETLRKQELQE